MKARITKDGQDKLLESTIKKQLENARLIGMSIASKTVSQVIYDMLNDNTKTDSEKIENAKRFCERGLDNKVKEGGVINNV